MNLTALAIAASVIKILDFQGRAIDLTNGVSNDFTPVQVFAPSDVAQQQWILQSSLSSGEGPFKIVNNRAGTFLSYPSANTGLTDISNVIRQQAMTHSSSGTTWNLVTVATGFHIIEAATGLALTSWGADPQASSPSNPLTLEAPVAGNRQQTFTITHQ